MPVMPLMRAVVAVCELRGVMPSRIVGFAQLCRACRVAVLVLICTVAVACKGGTDGISGPASAASKFLPERPGQQLAVGVLSSNITPLRWDSDDEILYTGLDGASAAVARAELRAIRVGSGIVRVIDAAPSRDASYYRFATTRDGRHTFFLLGALYYAVADSARLLVANGIQYVAWGGISLLEGTASGKIVFSTAPDSAWIFDAATRTKRLLATGCEQVVTGSPDGRQVLCIGSTSRATSVIDVGTGATSAGSGFAGPEVDYTPLHWGPRGVERIRSGAFYAADIINLATGAALTIIPSTEGQPIDFTNGDFPDPSSFAWSKDGKRIGYRRDLCYSPGFSICERSQSQLYVFDVETKETRLAAVINRPVGSITFSPDGTRLAYLTYGGGASSSVYVVARP